VKRKEGESEMNRKVKIAAGAGALLAGAGVVSATAASASVPASCYQVRVFNHSPHASYLVRGCAPTQGYAPTANQVARDLKPLVLPPWFHVFRYGHFRTPSGKTVYYAIVGGGNSDTTVRVQSNGKVFPS
jgi:hypothetical protein